jgi:glycosyltransferase involved in cell wall biosynthesis
MKKRVLFVSIAFPPKGDPECAQAGRYFRGLSFCENVVVDVVTSANPTLFMPIDPSLLGYANVTGQLIEVSLYESKYTNFILRRIFPKILGQPDSKMTFHWQWKNVVNKIVNKPDVIYSRSYPLSSTIMAWKLSRYFQVPWVLHLSDPWTENTLHTYSPFEHKYHSRMEKTCFSDAASISFTSQKTLELYQEKYPKLAHKFWVSPNVYDSKSDLAPLPHETKQADKLKIVYTGGLANTRTARPLLEALNALGHQVPLLTEKCEILFAGDMDRKNRTLFTEFQLPFVRHLGLIPMDEAMSLQRSADLLIVIDSKISDPRKAVFFPSKLLDYSILRKSILAITDKGSVTNDFVRNQGGICFAHDEIHELSEWLKSFLLGDTRVQMKPLDSKFGSDYQARRLVGIFEKILA